MKVKLGEKYRDTVTGFEGTAVARCEFLNGCVQIELVPDVAIKDGEQKLGDTAWFDDDRLVLVKTGAKAESTATRGGGFRSYPR